MEECIPSSSLDLEILATGEYFQAALVGLIAAVAHSVNRHSCNICREQENDTEATQLNTATGTVQRSAVCRLLPSACQIRSHTHVYTWYVYAFTCI